MRPVWPCWQRYCALLLLLVTPLAWSSANVLVETRPTTWATQLDKHFNLYRMDTGLYRSALPDTEAYPLLQELGIKTVINFYQRSDASWLSDPYIHQVQLPLHTDRIGDADALEVLRNVRQAQAYGPVLIHCKHGQNRTGLVAALYRVVYQGWTKEQALAEMRFGGFGGEQRMDDAERYLRQVDVTALKAALASGACSTRSWDLCYVGAWLNNAFSQR